jgi:predicted nuclease of predicted toxin-antitoxin system
MRILIDMNLSPRWVQFLIDRGIGSAHWSSLGKYDASDFDIMRYARTHDYIVLTHDLDFGAILAATHGEKPSVVQIRAEEINPETIGSQVVAAIQQLKTELEEGALLTIESGATRLRILPLRPRICA